MLTPTQRRHHLATIAGLVADIARHLPDAIDNLRDAQPGYPTATGGSGTRSSGLPSGLDRFVTMTDPAANDARRLDTALGAALRQLDEARSLVTTWATSIGPEGQPRLERRASGGDCLACGRYCSGNATTNDRLRAGLCDACRKHWRRWSATNPTSDRGEWMLERKRMIVDEDDQHVA